jgi:hypothetical protein
MDGFSDNCVVLYIQENVRLIYMEFSGFHTPEYKRIDWKDYEGQPEVIQKELIKRHAYRADLQYATEGFSATTSPSVPSVPSVPFQNFNTIPNINSVGQNITIIQELQEENAVVGQELLTKYVDLSNNVVGLLDKREYLLKNNEKYHYWGKDDPNVILRPEESKDIRMALQNDINDMKLYQNSIYISTAIACATFLIAAIIISKP